MPLTVRSPTLSLSAIRMSQVEVPMTFTSALGCAPAPTAPMWQSKAPPEGHTLRQTQRWPTLRSACRPHIGRPVSVNSGRQMLVDDGIKLIEEAGRRQTAPALMPQRFMSGAAAAAQILRTRSTESRAGTQSQSSTHEAAAGRRRYLRE